MLLLAFAALPPFVLSGCGSSGGDVPYYIGPPDPSPPDPSLPGGSRGEVVFTVRWPERSPTATTRFIPGASNSLRFRVFEKRLGSAEAPKLLVERVEPRPTDGPDGLPPASIVRLEGLPAVTVGVEISAYPTFDGTGTAQAAGAVEVKVEEGKEARQDVTLQSTIAEVRIAPEPAEVGFSRTQEFTATAYDAAGAIVLVAPGRWRWTVGGTGVVRIVSTDGDRITLSGERGGQEACPLRATETESLKERQVFVRVTDLFYVTPAEQVSLIDNGTVGKRVLFAHRNDAVVEADWAAAAGSLTHVNLGGKPAVEYTAPAAAGTYTVTASNRNNPRQTATATVNVRHWKPAEWVGVWKGRGEYFRSRWDPGLNDWQYTRENVDAAISITDWNEAARTVRVTMTFTFQSGTQVTYGSENGYVQGETLADANIQFFFNVPGNTNWFAYFKEENGTSDNVFTPDGVVYNFPPRSEWMRVPYERFTVTNLTR